MERVRPHRQCRKQRDESDTCTDEGPLALLSRRDTSIGARIEAAFVARGLLRTTRKGFRGILRTRIFRSDIGPAAFRILPGIPTGIRPIRHRRRRAFHARLQDAGIRQGSGKRLIVIEILREHRLEGVQLQFQTRGKLRFPKVDGDDVDAFGNGEVYFPPAVMGLREIRRDEGNQAFGTRQGISDIFGPFAARLDALVIPDGHAEILQEPDKGDNTRTVPMRIADEGIG